MRSLFAIFVFFSTGLGWLGWAAPTEGNSPTVATDPAYVLSPGDTITLSVQGEPELQVSQLIDRNGIFRLALLGDVPLAGKSVRDAEEAVARAYREEEYLRAPVVRISVVEYSPRWVTVLGEVGRPGKIAFPRDAQSMEIIDVITQAGGLTRAAKGESATLTRVQSDGTETVIPLNLQAIMAGRRPSDSKGRVTAILPGDRILVPQTIF